MNKKIFFFLGSAVTGFMVFLVVHFSFLKILENTKNQTQNLRIKQMISGDIKYDIIKAKTLFYQVPLLSTNIRSLNLNISNIKKELNNIDKLLKILNNGGVYVKTIPLNIVNKNSFEKKYIYKKSGISLENIDLAPKIKLLNKKAQQLEKLFLSRLKLKKAGKLTLQEYKKSRRKIVRFSKGLDSIFRRMIENSNRLFYESQIELLKLEKELKQKTLNYQNLEFSLIIFLILMFIGGGSFIFKELTTLNEALKTKLYVDELTKSYSRAKLEEMEFSEKSLLILVDIDDFSDINELYGIEVGNKLLQIVAQKLQKKGPKFTLFRVSADVFGMYLDDFSQMQMSIEDKVSIIRNELTFEPIKIDEYEIDINITLGVAFGGNLLHDSLAALSMAKNEKVIYKIFLDEDEFKKQIEFNKTWQKEIKYAIKNDNIEPFFQPIVDEHKNVIKYECLMRMKQNDRYIPPFFLDIAIKTKQYLSLSKMVIEKSFIKFKDKGEFSINLSYIDMKIDFTKQFLEDLIIKYNAQNRVTFEILESESIEDYMVIQEFLEYFKKYGVKIAIDDFGSGYSNFKRIMELQPDYIKLDASLIKNIAVDNASYVIVKTMVNYAKELKIKTIAEFVHDKDTFDTCVYLGVDYLQGYYISKPIQNI